MKRLLIVESPAKIKTISKFLGNDFKIMSTMGHIKDLPANKIGVTIDDKDITLEYVPLEGKDKLIAQLCKEASKADQIYLAPDPDREGEIIAWHVEQEVAKVAKNPKEVHRIAFNEITKNAILEALEHPSHVDLDKVNAQQARRILDRWVGYEVSPILWRKITKGLSAGRVQSVALKLIVDREQEIRDFKPVEYWSIDSLFAHKKAELTAELTHIKKKKAELPNKEVTQKIVDALANCNFSVESVTDKTRIKNAPAPFMTSTLQQAAYNQLGFSVKKTMQIAQRLYEGIPLQDPSTPVALITYMRTDSVRISDTALTQARDYVSKQFGKDYLPPKAIVYAKGKGKDKGQDAHEAIRPIDVTITPESVQHYLPADEAKLYTLLWKRFVACQMSSAQYAQRQVVIQGGDYTFKATGSTLIFDGYLKVYKESDEPEDEKISIIPAEIVTGLPLELKKVLPEQHFTQAPPRFTEASLVKELEKEGIGRPSTYASILNTIRARDYTTLDTKKRFVPTELGATVTKMLTEYLPKIMDRKFTAHMEEDLDKIAQGDVERNTLLRTFRKDFEKDLETFAGPDVRRPSELTDIDCPECKKNKLLIRIGKAGAFLGCSGYPECNFTSNFKRLEDGTIEFASPEGPQLLQESCPNCSKPLRKVIGKFGPFIACSGYPECTYIHQEKAGFPCPTDGGVLIKKQWKGGSFWGCKNYPECKFAIFGAIEETPCPECKSPFLIVKKAKDGSVNLSCNNKECGYAIKRAAE